MRDSILHRTHEALGWPTHAEILHPSGQGASAVARLASEKIRRSLAGYPGTDALSVGILTTTLDATESPLAIVCEFATPVPDDTLLQAQRIAWNFNRSLLLVTAEPHAIRVWSCYETPVLDRHGTRIAPEGEDPAIATVRESATRGWVEAATTEGLHWASLVSGAFVRRHASRFPTEEKADRALLANLRAVRDRLHESGLPDAVSHDLLARVIFVQFLFDRRDSQGRAALDAQELAQLHEFEVLSARHETLADVLSSYDDAYALFRYLNRRFNGDLFPGGSRLPEEGDGWAIEQNHVRPEHLRLLSRFVEGILDLESGQHNLWQLYAFDAIPLDLISSIYEQFVDKEAGTGIHYTPGHLVDLILDSVLPWDHDDWNVRVLDPACGSGIFLVKAYQRLVYRWKRAEGQSTIPVSVLKRLLTHNVFGVDKDPGAVRVAAFSLYLAMCDEIDPRDYWSHAALDFPVIQGHRIVEVDFFDEDTPGIQTDADAGTYDIVVGNPPFGDGTIRRSDAAGAWAEAQDWPVANHDIGTLFLAKAAELTRKGGAVGLVQSAAALLYNEKAATVRHKVFFDHRRIESVTMFARFPLFDDVRVPTCVLVLRNYPPDGSPFWYICPKRHSSDGDASRIVLDRHDVHAVTPYDVLDEPWVWETLAWGGARDRALVRQLMRCRSLNDFAEAGDVTIRVGVNRGNRKKDQPALLGRKILESPAFPETGSLWLNASNLPINHNVAVHSRDSTNFAAFELPQLIVKLSWIQSVNRFQAQLVGEPTVPSNEGEGVLCSQSYATVHGDEHLLKLAAVTLNSSLATYFLFLSSGRFAFDRSQPNPDDLYNVPLPPVEPDDPAVIEALAAIRSVDDVDPVVFDLFGLAEAERILVQDLVGITLRDFRGRSPKPGYRPTLRAANEGHASDVVEYARILTRVIEAAYGDAVPAAVEVFQEEYNPHLPVRVAQVVIGRGATPGVTLRSVDPRNAYEHLAAIYAETPAVEGQCVTDYRFTTLGGYGAVVVTLVKPDLARYWTRSAALRDADALVADLGVWRTSAPPSVEGEPVA